MQSSEIIICTNLFYTVNLFLRFIELIIYHGRVRHEFRRTTDKALEVATKDIFSD